MNKLEIIEMAEAFLRVFMDDLQFENIQLLSDDITTQNCMLSEFDIMLVDFQNVLNILKG